MSRSRHVGKIRKRLEDVKSQWVRPARADFSDNESARLATDALLDGGPEAYWQALGREGEVDFLSSVEAQYIQAQAKQPPCAPEPPGGAEAGPKGLDSCSLQSGTYFPVASEGSEPTLLHSWTSAQKPYLKEKSSATVYFQTDKHNNIRDLIRRCITRTSQVLAILMDVFTDVEIFCDILEAANKRGVFVCVLLDQGGVKLFQEMCDKVQISDSHLKNISIRSVEGEVYCAKSGRKFAGQIQEKFIISDWRYVLSGSYRGTWLFHGFYTGKGSDERQSSGTTSSVRGSLSPKGISTHSFSPRRIVQKEGHLLLILGPCIQHSDCCSPLGPCPASPGRDSAGWARLVGGWLRPLVGVNPVPPPPATMSPCDHPATFAPHTWVPIIRDPEISNLTLLVGLLCCHQAQKGVWMPFLQASPHF
ncbi:Hypothetical predicted protein [Lynx pardinus]|uniref:Scaffolding anchor of CK1 domain-containing protein n=1 Tax=Lynx pardinus TaxID=191816 RepID=A0A485NQX4_LYNPA|nr:Hypothetical predicted protein [Lynx pardinus]